MKQVIAFFLALGISFFLFLLMSALINKEAKAIPHEISGPISWSNDVTAKAPEEIVRTVRKKPEMKPLVKPPGKPQRTLEEKVKPVFRTQDFKPETKIKIALRGNSPNDIALSASLGDGLQTTDSDLMPKIRIEPQYPREPAMKGIEGFVTLSFDINALGQPVNVQVVEAKPKGYFEKNAKKALRKWKYSPKKENGHFVEVKNHQVTLTFQLEKG